MNNRPEDDKKDQKKRLSSSTSSSSGETPEGSPTDERTIKRARSETELKQVSTPSIGTTGSAVAPKRQDKSKPQSVEEQVARENELLDSAWKYTFNKNRVSQPLKKSNTFPAAFFNPENSKPWLTLPVDELQGCKEHREKLAKKAEEDKKSESHDENKEKNKGPSST